MKKYIILILITIFTSGCGFLLVDVPIRVPIKGQQDFINKKYVTKQDMYIVKYRKESGYFMYAQADATEVEEINFIPKGSIIIGSHITRLNGWPNGTYFHYVAKMKNWEIFSKKFVVQTQMDESRYKPLDSNLFEAVK